MQFDEPNVRGFWDMNKFIIADQEYEEQFPEITWFAFAFPSFFHEFHAKRRIRPFMMHPRIAFGDRWALI